MITIPPEWAPHRATWAAWPSHVDQWNDNYLPARDEIVHMIKALAKGERVKVLAIGDEAVNDARRAFDHDHVDVVYAAFGDIWLRDTSPIFGRDKHGPLALCFKFNGWGGRHVLKYDDEVAGFIARASGLRMKRYDFELEGGGVDFDGDGRVIATRECLLDPQRNPGKSEGSVEQFLQNTFGVNQVIWLDKGLKNDPAHGHVDNLARFVGPAKVVCQTASGSADPNAALYEAVALTLKEKGLEVVEIPSPGRVLGYEGGEAPASHLNFVIGNKSVIVPSFEGIYSREAVKILQSVFPDREVMAIRADHLMAGGAAFHAITRQEPAF